MESSSTDHPSCPSTPSPYRQASTVKTQASNDPYGRCWPTAPLHAVRNVQQEVRPQRLEGCMSHLRCGSSEMQPDQGRPPNRSYKRQLVASCRTLESATKSQNRDSPDDVRRAFPPKKTSPSIALPNPT